jgi:5-methyltetrahydrofolate--homocysteine methyltransferase
MSPTILELAAARPVLLDGGLGSELMKRGLPQGATPELWNVEKPEILRALHREYFEAGSDAVSTNSFGASRIKLDALGLGARCVELNRAAAVNAAAVRPVGKFAGGSLGPTGKFLKPQGAFSPGEFEDAFAEQARALLDGGVDFLILETFFDLREALCALRGARRGASTIPVLATLTFNKNRRGFFTMMGDGLAASAAALEKDGASAVGANCTLTSEAMIDLARELRRSTALPIILQPNAGQPEMGADGRTVYAQSPDRYAADMAEIAAAGANFLGGCCGTDPEFIRRLAARLNR